MTTIIGLSSFADDSIPNSRVFSKKEINSIFTMAQNINFFSYGSPDNYPYKTNSYPYCRSSAAVIGDQVQRRYKKQVGQTFIFFKDTYQSHCRPEYAYGYHTVITLLNSKKQIVVIDPTHVDNPLPLNKYLRAFTKNDCKLTSFDKMKDLAEEAGSQVAYFEDIDNNGQDLDLNRLESYRSKILNKMINKSLTPIATGVSGLPNKMFGDTADIEQIFINSHLTDRHFFYVYNLSSLVTKSLYMAGVNNLVPQNISFFDRAYSWVIPRSTDSRQTLFYHEAQAPFVKTPSQ